MQLIKDERVWTAFRLVEALFPLSPIGSAPPLQRRAFLCDQRFGEGLALSRWKNNETRLSQAEIALFDWLPGTIQGIYGTTDRTEIAKREHLSRLVKVHPGIVNQALPLNKISLEAHEEGPDVVVRTGKETPDIAPVKAFWSNDCLLRSGGQAISARDPGGTGSGTGRGKIGFSARGRDTLPVLQNAGTPVRQMSGTLIDMALAANVPIIAVRCVGALPVEVMEKRLDFPLAWPKRISMSNIS